MSLYYFGLYYHSFCIIPFLVLISTSQCLLTTNINYKNLLFLLAPTQVLYPFPSLTFLFFSAPIASSESFTYDFKTISLSNSYHGTRCIYCSKNFMNKRSLKDHLRSYHSKFSFFGKGENLILNFHSGCKAPCLHPPRMWQIFSQTCALNYPYENSHRWGKNIDYLRYSSNFYPETLWMRSLWKKMEPKKRTQATHKNTHRWTTFQVFCTRFVYSFYHQIRNPSEHLRLR